MSSVENNDILHLAFTGKLDSGDVFIEITPDSPMRIVIGQSELPPLVEIGVIGMRQGERKKVRVPPEEGYGQRLKELVHEIPKKVLGNKIAPQPGMILSQKVEKDGIEERVPATVVEVKEDSVVIDYNHPLAGHHLTYDLTILEIIKAQ